MANYGRGRAGVIELFWNEVGSRPFAECKGPNESTLLWFRAGLRTVIVQVYAGGNGWTEYICPLHNNVDTSIADLKALQEEAKRVEENL